MIYLSHVLSADTPTYGGIGLCRIEHSKNITKGDSSNNSQIHFSSHTGTHIDAPYHFYNDGKTIDDYSLEI
jgi:kynurenine formamidase|tara:strand:+ start:2355 stop:2567 length:213 start_codon:yes stop_codon:yes gene_type:complete